MSKENSKRKIPAAVIGILIPILYSNIGHILSVRNSLWGVVILAILYISAGVYIWEGTFKGSSKAVFIILLFTPVGVFVDLNIDGFFRHFNRNLFPLEIVFFWLIGPILLFVGMGLRKLLLKD